MFSFATGPVLASHRSILLAVCWPGPTANLSHLSFDGVVSANSQCFCCSMDSCRTACVQVPERSAFLSAFQTSGRKKRAVSNSKCFSNFGNSRGNVFGRRSTVLLQREVFVDLNDDGQAPESVLFLLFRQKRFMETFPPPSILRLSFGFGFTGFRSGLFIHFSWHVDFRYAPTPRERKVSRETCGAIGQYLIDLLIDFTPLADRLVVLAARGFSARRWRASRLAASRLDFCPSEDYLENLWDQGILLQAPPIQVFATGHRLVSQSTNWYFAKRHVIER